MRKRRTIKVKRILSMALVFCLCMLLLPNVAEPVEAASTGLTLTQLQQKFPHGKYWNGGNANSYTSSPCNHHGGCSYTGSCGCNSFLGLSIQCMGYAEKLGYDATGYNPRNNANGWYTYTSSSALDNLKPGDVVRYKNNGHSIYVTGVNGDTVTYTDCNSDGHCIIRWNVTISKSTLRSSFTHVRSAPFSVSPGSGGTTVTTHTVDSSYGTNFKAYPKAKITAGNIYDANHNQISSGAWIGTSDQCTIHEVYTDGCCKVTYPLDAGGTKTVYSKISLFNVSSPRVKYWLSDTEYGDTPSEYKVGNRYYFCYKFYDATSGKNWDEIEDCDYTFNLTFYNPDGSVKYTNQNVFDDDQSWISSIFTEPGTYTAKLVMSGDYTLEGTRTFTVQENPIKVNCSTNSVSLKLGETESQTIYAGYSGYYNGNWSIYYNCSNSNVSCTWGEWTDDHRSPLTIKANAMGTTTVTISIKDKDTGAVLNSTTVTVSVDAKSYTVSYNANGGSGAPGSQTKYYNTTLTLSSTKPTRTGYTFLGWSTSSAASSATYQSGGSFTGNANTTLYAVWKANTYTVTYNANGGTGAPSSQTKTHGVNLTLSTTKPTRTGYTFLGWSTSSTATSATYQPGSSFTGNANTTLYAVWKANTTALSVNSTNSAVISTGGEMKYFTFTPTTSGKYVIYSTGSDDTKVYLYNASGTELDSDDDDGDGNNFRLEYSLTAGTTYTFGIKYYNSSKTGTISFKFGNVFTVTYNANGGSGAPSAQSKDYGTNIALSSTTPKRTGYTFLGWATSSTATSATYHAGSSFSSNANTTLYAVWKAHTYSIMYISNGGSGTMSNSSHTYDISKSLSLNAFTRSGYSFLGWATSISATTATYTNGQSVKNLSATNGDTVVLYAVWSKIPTYTINYNSNGGVGAPAGQIKAKDVSLTLSSTKPTRAGYTFLGWATSSTATSATYQPGGSFTSNSNTTLYAVWKLGCEDAHSYSYAVTTNPTSSAAGKLTGTCSKCSGTATVTLPKLTTTDYSYKVTKAATCTVAGTGRYTWKTTTYGSFYFDVSIAKLGHSYTAKVTAPTCTAQGYTTHTCSRCSDSYKDTYTNATGHSYSYTVTTKPTTSAAGKLTGTCSKCSGTTTVALPKLTTTDYTYTVTKAATCTAAGTGRYTWKTTTYGSFYFEVSIAKLGHSYTAKVTAPTCTAQGYTTHTCSRCSDSYKDTYTNATGHSYSYTATAKPTTSAAGKLTGTCSKCSGTTTVTLPKLTTTDYSYKVTKAATCTVAGTGRYTWKTTTYGSFYFDVSIAKLGHSYTAKVTAPTCTAQGYTTHTCSRCSDSCKDTYTSATGHSYSYTVTTKPTTSAAGKLTGTCSKCSGTTTVTLPKLTTTDYSYKVVKEPTYSAAGSASYTWKTTTYGVYSFDVVLAQLEPDVMFIEIEAEPAKTEYEVGESLDTTGLLLRVTYNNFTTGIVDAGYTVSGFDSGSVGTNTVTVSYGGASASFSVSIVKPKFNLAGANMELGNSLTMYLYVNKSDVSEGSYYMEIVKTYADGRVNEVRTVPMNNWVAFGNMYRIGFSGVAAKEMADEFYVTVYRSDGTQASNTKEISIAQYAISVLNSTDANSAASHNLMADMLNYGAAAQQSLKYGLNDLANAKMTAAHKACATKNFSMDQFSNNTVKGTGFMGANLSLESSICMNVYFDSAIVDKTMTARVSYTNHSNKKVTYQIPGSEFFALSGYGFYGVEIDTMVAADAESMVTVEILNGSKVVASGSTSVESLAFNGYASVPLYVDLMKFCAAAYNFFH